MTFKLIASAQVRWRTVSASAPRRPRPRRRPVRARRPDRVRHGRRCL